MAKLNLYFLIFVTLLVISTTALRVPIKSVNGGIGCAACTVVVGLIEQLSIVYNTTVEDSLYKFCDYFPKGLIKDTCDQAVDEYAKIIINGLYANASADLICHALRFCHTDPGQPECHAFPIRNGKSLHQSRIELENLFQQRNIDLKVRIQASPCNNPIFKPLCNLIEKAFGNHKASEDVDGDRFSTFETLRGTSWRGKDCNDLSGKVYPGLKPKGNDSLEDTNCNGIFGINPDGISYEDLYCKNSQQRGYAVLGDSISAHFHIPEEWVDATKISKEAFDHIIFIIENELDWPQLGYNTGHIQNQWPVVQGNTSSMYLKLWQRNKCNFRDFQNIAVNGADSNEMIQSIVQTLARNQNADQPLIVLYSLVGNDVCNGAPDTFNHMTTLSQMYTNVVQTMQYLDTTLPYGSHVLLTGLANGSMLYDLVGERVYPFGKVKGDILYKDMYTYLSCLQVSPCNGWLTTNATVRNLTTLYAVQLSEVIKNVTQTYRFKNFDMHYLDFPFDEVIRRWVAQGNEAWQLIEPVDGFHINQYAQPIVSDVLWEYMEQYLPDWLGPINPFNDEIAKIFGDQGGY